MGRKSLRAERTVQILDAFERCIVKNGFQNTTLQDIADEAGVNRGILRHHIGNREDIVDAVIDRLDEKYDQTRFTFLKEQAANSRPRSLIEYFFDLWFEFGRDDDTLFQELITASERDERLRAKLFASYQSLEASISDELVRSYPHVREEKCRTIAHSIMSLAFGHTTMVWLGFDRALYPGLRKALASLLTILEEENRERSK